MKGENILISVSVKENNNYIGCCTTVMADVHGPAVEV